jgi:hypothetical protein
MPTVADIEIFDAIEQGTPEWFAIRAGIPTASEFAKLLARGRSGGESEGRRKYLNRLAAEIYMGKPADPEWEGNRHTRRGHELEPEARELYSIATGHAVVQVGFVRNGRKGCSPDGLILGPDGKPAGAVQIKTLLPHLMVAELLLSETRCPPEHKAQVQGEAWICEIEWVDVMMHCPGLPPIIHHEPRDRPYIMGLISAHAQFLEELDAIVERVRARA